MLKRVLLLFMLSFTGYFLYAQVTTSAISGSVKDKSGQGLTGATIIATHTPSGTKYTTVSQSNGQFNISNMRVGGPYLVEVSYVGFQTQRENEVYLKLGEASVFNLILENAGNLEQVVVTASRRNNILNANRTGAVTNIGRTQIERLPTISRSINDLSRLTPQSNGASVGGGNNRQNYITVDGSDFNNAFGIGSNLPAGGAPISLDALEEISVNITPFDIRQSGFIGSSLNAVTRAGTNNFTGSAYYFFRTEKQQGNKVGKESFPKQKLDFDQYGIRVGGPIIKNKLFFFLNYETETQTSPGQQRLAATGSAPFGSSNNIARPTVDELNAISDYLRTNYEYETGGYQDYPFESPRKKYLARVDWNISSKHRLNVRYSNVKSKTPSFVSGSLGSTGITGVTGSRTDNTALHFKNSNYFQENNFNSIAAELNSTFGKVSNNLRVSRNNQNEPRSVESSLFPFVDIMKDNLFFTSFGYEPFSYGNLRDVLIYSAVDNVTWTSGKHSFIFGGQVDFTDTKNGFQPLGASYYRFASFDDFKNGVKPLDFTLTYSLLPNFQQAFPSFKFSQYSAYGQDEISLGKTFKLTLGLRADLTTYPDVTEVKTNPLVAGLTFAEGAKINTGTLPKPTINWAPRVGFNWDVHGDRSFQVRGGTGIFTGRIPFVWIVGQSGNSGMLQVTQNYNGQNNTPGPFNPDPAFYRPATVPQAGTVVPSTVTAFSEDFKNPQSWKTSLGIDKRLPGGFVGTLEGIFNKDIRTTYSRNVNLVNPQSLNISGYPDNRLIYPNATNQKYLNPLTAATKSASNPNPSTPVANGDTRGTQTFTSILTGNENRGYYFSLTAKLEKQFTRGFFGTIAYVFSNAANLYDGSGDQPVNTWNLIAHVNGPNFPTLGTASYVLPHRVVASVSYRKEFIKHLGTSLSLFYEGAHQGRFSYTYGGDFNRDGANFDLIYIPKDPSEIDFTNKTISGVVYTAQQQKDLLFSYIEQDKYLRKHKGQYAERNAALLPWRNQFDVKFLQDIFTNFAGKRNTLQFSVDVFNLANLINRDWGLTQTTNSGFNGQILIPQNQASLVPGGTVRPTFQLATDRNHIITETFRDNTSLSSTYYMQFGLRYIFGQ
ncbi:MAG TPA: carboxypeptidase regulatory-like domain-containing protein [Chitinophagaceae bacterium]|nr:carboxypeptidase regulatory-like domain-containing protein [Chitinophagaceae bacterium]